LIGLPVATAALDQKLTRGREIAAGVSLGAHGYGFQKILELHLQS